MVHIYCLIDPRTNKPFYVGATSGKLNIRLSSHLSDCRLTPVDRHNNKMKLIRNILDSGKRPKIRLLQSVTLHEADHYEKFFFTLLRQQGFELLQQDYAFSYKSKRQNDLLYYMKRNKNRGVILFDKYQQNTSK
jgi:hypothetical protein